MPPTQTQPQTDWQPAVYKSYKNLCQSFRDRMLWHDEPDVTEEEVEHWYNKKMSGRIIRVRPSTWKQINERCSCNVLEVHPDDCINGGRYVPECSVSID